MDTINRNHLESTIVENIAPLLHRSEKSASRAGASKADARYWMVGKRLALHDSANYSIQIYKQGHRVWFPLGTPNKKTAAAKAAEIYAVIMAQGWQAALDRYKPSAPARPDSATVGDLIRTATSVSSARPESLAAYTKAFRLIVSEIAGIDGDGKGGKHDFHRGGVATWRANVDLVPLAAVTPAKVLAWKNIRLRKAGSDPLVKRHATVTVNSLIRNARTLFALKTRPFIAQQINLPAPLPFDGVSLEKAPTSRYHSKMDPRALLSAAREELPEVDLEVFKILVLALVCGLRRAEIDSLLWRNIDFPSAILRVEVSEYRDLKSEGSTGEIALDPDTVALLRGWRAKAPAGVFVIESTASHKRTRLGSYRCNSIFGRAISWLKSKGINDQKPIHTLRKEIGAIIATEHGIYAASRYLRHSDVHVTSSYYADLKERVTPKTFAGLLAPLPAETVDFHAAESAPPQGSGKAVRKANE